MYYQKNSPAKESDCFLKKKLKLHRNCEGTEQLQEI